MENNNSEDRKDNIKPGTILGFRFPPKENLEDIENDPDYWENNNPEEWYPLGLFFMRKLSLNHL